MAFGQEEAKPVEEKKEVMKEEAKPVEEKKEAMKEEAKPVEEKKEAMKEEAQPGEAKPEVAEVQKEAAKEEMAEEEAKPAEEKKEAMKEEAQPAEADQESAASVQAGMNYECDGGRSYTLHEPGVNSESHLCELDAGHTEAPADWYALNQSSFCREKLQELIELYNCAVKQ